MGFHAHGPYGAYLRGTINEYAEHHKGSSDSDSKPYKPFNPCEHCKVIDPIYTEKTYCDLYNLARRLGRKPTVLEATEKSIKISRIHANCPEGYFTLKSPERG